MRYVLFVLLIAGVIVIIYVLRWRLTQSRRKQLRAAPFPVEWRQILARNVALYNRLPDPLKDQLHGHIQVFLAEKNFEGCGGLKITDEIRITIAAQACMLLLNGRSDCYPRLYSVLVYPKTYVATKATHIGLGSYAEVEEARLGESWRTGAVVLSWDDVVHGTADVMDGHNLVLHEFAHQLDQEYSAAEGAPLLERRSRYVTWARIFGKAYERLQTRVAKGKKTVIHQYGATNPAEFFAVATETFFEKPRQLKEKYPDLYEELRGYYQLDPIEWV